MHIFRLLLAISLTLLFSASPTFAQLKGIQKRVMTQTSEEALLALNSASASRPLFESHASVFAKQRVLGWRSQ